jgi:hypothetical protein
MIRDLVKEILKEELIGSQKTEPNAKVERPCIVDGYNGNILDHMIGKLVMVRTYSAGVHFGTLKAAFGKEVMLGNSHRVHYWTNACSLSQLSQEGSKGKNSENRISMSVPEILLTEAIEVIPMPQDTFDAITSHIWKK